MRGIEVTPAELDAILARADAATPGPWRVIFEPEAYGTLGGEMDPDRVHNIFGGPDERTRIVETDGGCYPPRKPDAIFIAHARTDVPALVADNRKLQAKLAAAVAFMERWDDCCGRDCEMPQKDVRAVIEALK